MNAITAEARQALRAALADPFAGMSERDMADIYGGKPLPEGKCGNRDICESYARDNRGGLLIDALVNDSRVLVCLARGDMAQLSIEWDRVLSDVIDTVAEKMR